MSTNNSLADTHLTFIQPSSYIILHNGDFKRRRNKLNLKINNLIINKRLHNFTEFSKSDFFIRTYFFNNISNSFHFFL